MHAVFHLASQFAGLQNDLKGLPLNIPLADWTLLNAPLKQIPIGICRHPVAFFHFLGTTYACKELPDELAIREYELLCQLQERQVSTVVPVGYVLLPERRCSLLITRYLEHSVPYRLLFVRDDLDTYREHLLDAITSLLVELHMNGVFWGDCSLSNTLFRQDAGYLQAYLVDAETSEAHGELSDALRDYELDIMEENISGALADLMAEGKLCDEYPVFEVGASIRERYQKLWQEINHSLCIEEHQKFKIQERVRKLNALGFSVEQVMLEAEGQNQLQFQVRVADRHYHRNQLERIIGIEVEEQQAILMLNEIQDMRTEMSQKENRSVPVSPAAQQWFKQVYLPVMQQIKRTPELSKPPIELYCLMLEHKWYLSEKAQEDVGHLRALTDYLETILNKSPQIDEPSNDGPVQI